MRGDKAGPVNLNIIFTKKESFLKIQAVVLNLLI